MNAKTTPIVNAIKWIIIDGIPATPAILGINEITAVGKAIPIRR